MDCLDFLSRRRSVPARLLGEPGPTQEQVQAMLAAAVRVPDHGKLAPWRFLCIRGDARQALGELLATRLLEREPAAAPAQLDKERQRFVHAPLVLAVVACLVPGHKVPEQEQLLSGGALCFALLQAAQALGFGAQWLTGWAAYDPAITARLGLASNERILGFIHIGTPQAEAPERPRPDPMQRLADWTP
ncbi:nitroreductase family protein [Arenimonas fontis]|uniref:Putative NAD(P)H nitroreductase n=1 Tax=Arenimonas fontis TaxID=2608255 RepID=A0A5B2ZA72_9GAMM|nr:nitroreductase [Arenimonas fontis]KAA2284180.1 nitroreductase [Arenimonas fontis]